MTTFDTWVANKPKNIPTNTIMAVQTKGVEKGHL